MTDPISGGCLCGDVRYQVNGEPLFGGHCQCASCRKSSGTGHCSHMGVAKSGFTASGRIEVYESPTDSGNMVGRAFCPRCGAPVYSLNSGFEDIVFVRASSLDDPEIFQPQMVVFTQHSPSWDRIDPNLPAFEAMPPAESMPQ
ncbi:MAG: GFA family protein [Alphaproteobacteria bacterium]|nr:GFA family protein [Alphaproteobacteria bacterium]